ncbi:TPR repeat protein [Raphidiopsis brookii D9]|nr:TPR repeat protein [Raphidiopsis brookii D9]
MGRYPEAITAFDNAIKQKPEFIHLAYYGKGLALSRSGKVMEAVIALEEAVKAKSDSVLAWTILSLANTKLGRSDQALLAINQAIKLQPNNPNLYNEKLVVLSNLKRYQEAIDAIDQAIKLSPHADFYYNRGVVRSRLGDNQGAIADLQKAADLLQKQGLSAE